MNKRQITVVLLINYLGIGGAEQQLVELARGIDKERFKTLVVCLYPGGPLESEVQEIPGVELISLDRKGKYDFFILTKIFRLLRQRKVDVVQPFLTPASFFGLLPAIIARTPVRIVTERCGLRVNPSFGNRLYRKVEDLLTHFADCVIPNSASGQRYLIDRGINPARIKIIYNGINLKRLTPDETKVTEIRGEMRLPSDGMAVGITASLTLAKDHATFLKAAKIIHQAIPQTRFGILGSGPLLQSLWDIVRELDLESCVTFFGNQQDVGSYISAFDVVCLSSADHEGCSNATLEAMALGKPVVITNVGGNGELVNHEETGLLVPARNPEALANGVLTCLKQPNWARDMGQRGRETVTRRFSFSRMINEYEQLYEQTVRLN